MESCEERILDLGEFRAAFSTRSDGNMSTVQGFKENQLAFFDRRGIDRHRVRILQPWHSPNAAIISGNTGDQLQLLKIAPIIDTDLHLYYDGYDALLTFNQSLVLGVISADCVPVLFWEQKSGLFGVAHVGLLGILNRMLTHVASILEQKSVSLGRVNYLLGPGLRGRHYDLNVSGLWTAILPQVKTRAPWVFDRCCSQNGKLLFDMHDAIVSELRAYGSTADLIQTCDISTADAESPFYSHYAWKHYGRERGNFLSLLYVRD